MSKTIAVSVPDDLARELDRAKRGAGTSRSAVVQKALEEYLRVGESRREALVAKYREAYLANADHERRQADILTRGFDPGLSTR